MDYNIDKYLSECWNSNSNEKIFPEDFWDYCRILEKNGILKPNETAISAISIGPFKMVSNLDVSNKEFFSFFIETIIPIQIANNNNLSFNEVYSLFLIPVLHIFLNLLSGSHFITDELQWEIILYIKQKNSEKHFPNFEDIKNNFSSVNPEKIEEALLGLSDLKNLLGDEKSIVLKDDFGGYKSLV